VACCKQRITNYDASIDFANLIIQTCRPGEGEGEEEGKVDGGSGRRWMATVRRDWSGEGEGLFPGFIISSTYKGTQHRSNILFRITQFVKHYLVLAILCDRLKRGFTYLKYKGDRSLTNDDRVALLESPCTGLSVQRKGAVEMDGRKHGWEWALEKMGGMRPP
jgi:hypothetical protein